MTMQTYASPAGRINEVLGEIIAAVESVQVLSTGVTMKSFPRNKGDNITYRQWLPYGGATTNANTINRWSVSAVAHLIQEGVTPTADKLVPRDISVAMNQYAAMYSYTDKTEIFSEDDVPEAQKIELANRIALVREMILYGEMKGCTNAMFSGGTTRATVDEAISLNILRRMSKTLQANHAGMLTRVLGAGPYYDTSAVEAGYHVYVHTDAEPDIRDLPDFTPVAKYANKSPISPYELGSCERFRFITSPELSPIADSGASVGTTGLVSTSASQVDVYPYIVMGENAVYDIALKGAKGSNKGVTINHLKPGQIDKSDPGGQRGYIYGGFWSAAKIVNNGHMGVIEAGVTNV